MTTTDPRLAAARERIEEYRALIESDFPAPHWARLLAAAATDHAESVLFERHAPMFYDEPDWYICSCQEADMDRFAGEERGYDWPCPDARAALVALNVPGVE